MSKIVRKGKKILIISEVPITLQKEISKLLNNLMKDYQIISEQGNQEAFKKILKSNINVLIDNEYHNKKTQKCPIKDINMKTCNKEAKHKTTIWLEAEIYGGCKAATIKLCEKHAKELK